MALLPLYGHEEIFQISFSLRLFPPPPPPPQKKKKRKKNAFGPSSLSCFF